MEEVKKVGRPKLPEEDKKKYQKIAIYPHTYEKILKLKKKTGKQIIDLIDELVH